MTARQLRHGGLAEQVRAALEASGLPRESLLIEVPETAVRQMPEPLEAGARRESPPAARASASTTSAPATPRCRCCSACASSAVCIDRSLVAGVPDDTERAGLARALIALARGLNFEVVAKGVETSAQREFLAEAGCRICQGDLFAPPGAADEIEPFLRARRAA